MKNTNMQQKCWVEEHWGKSDLWGAAVQQPEHWTTEHAGLRDTMRHITSVTQQSIDIDRGTRAVIASEHTGYYHKITDDYLEDTNINISSTWTDPVSSLCHDSLAPWVLGSVLVLVLEHNLCSTVSTHFLYLFPADRREERCLNTDMMDGMWNT